MPGIHIESDAITLDTGAGKPTRVTMEECLGDTGHALLFACFMKLTEIAQYQKELLRVVAAPVPDATAATEDVFARVFSAMGGVAGAPPGMAKMMDALKKGNGAS